MPCQWGDPDRLNEFLDPFRRPWEITFPKPIVQAVKDAVIPHSLPGPGVLRNLSKRLFVRETALTALTTR
jgi:hypothetical protein